METQTAGSGVSGFFGRLGDILGPNGPRTLILLIGLLLLLLALFSISRQIARGRVRHRREYAAHVVQALREDPQCRMALAMLEGHDRRLPLLGPAAPSAMGRRMNR